jgi:hypothetical protein
MHIRRFRHGNINFMRHVFPDVKENSAEATLVTGFSLVALHPNLMQTKAERVAVMNALLEKVNTGNSLRFGDLDLTADRSEQGVYRFEALHAGVSSHLGEFCEPPDARNSARGRPDFVQSLWQHSRQSAKIPQCQSR